MSQLKVILEGFGLMTLIALFTFVLYFLSLFIKGLRAKNDTDQRRVIDESLRTHVHEAGHVIAAWLNPYIKKVEGVIVLRNGHGMTWMSALPVTTPSHAWHRLTVDLSGIAAEILIYKRTNPLGSAEDLKSALHLAQWIALADPEALHTPPWLDSSTLEKSRKSLGGVFASRPSKEATLVMDKAFSHTKSLIASRSDKLRLLVFALESGHGHLCTHEIEAIMGPRPVTTYAK